MVTQDASPVKNEEVKRTFQRSSTEKGEKYGLSELMVLKKHELSERSKKMMERDSSRNSSLFKKKLNLNVDMKGGMKSLFNSVKGIFN